MNPYLSRETHIPFAEMTPQAVEPALDEALTRAQTELDALTEKPERTFGTILDLDALVERSGASDGLRVAPDLGQRLTRTAPRL